MDQFTSDRIYTDNSTTEAQVQTLNSEAVTENNEPTGGQVVEDEEDSLPSYGETQSNTNPTGYIQSAHPVIRWDHPPGHTLHLP